MTTTITPITRPDESRAARLITDGLDPKTWIIADTVLVGWHTGRLAGIGWGLLGCLFAAVIPWPSSSTASAAAAGPTGTSARGVSASS